MKTGQFYRGKIDGIQKNFESPNLDQILPADKLAELANYSEVGEYPRFFKQEKALTKTVITEAPNTDGRRGGIVNHTVIYRYDQTVVHDGLKYTFPLEDFISEILSGERQIKMPSAPKYPADVDFAIIDVPPTLEWEV